MGVTKGRARGFLRDGGALGEWGKHVGGVWRGGGIHIHTGRLREIRGARGAFFGTFARRKSIFAPLPELGKLRVENSL